jgi:hypothetical protein
MCHFGIQQFRGLLQFFAMKDGGRKKNFVFTNGLTCEGCERQFVRAEHRVEHIITCSLCMSVV